MTERPNTIFNLNEGYDGIFAIDYLTCLNYAMYHNKSRSLIKCELANHSDSNWPDISITIDGQMLREHKAYLPEIPAKSSVDITRMLDIEVDPQELLGLSEGINTEIHISVTAAGTEILNQKLPLQLMAFDQWSGIANRPELLASFVTPNHPILSRVAVAASRFMQQFTGSADLDEYQSQDPNRVRAQIAAIYEALRAEGLVYASNPPSFESSGQRVRMVDKVLDEKLATCLDLSLLIASCLEAMGINPIIVLSKGHCMVGAWLVKDSHTRPVDDDADFLLKSAADGINEILVLESTAITSSDAVSFDQAIDMAEKTLRRTDDFVCFIDVYRARVCGVRPLPMRINDGNGWTVQNDGLDHRNSTKEVKEYDRYDLTSYVDDSVQLNKYNIWERKLLDFSLRNNLLNMRKGKKLVPLVSFSIDKLEDCVQNGGSLQILPWPIDKDPEVAQNGLYDSKEHSDLQDYLDKQLANKRLHSFLKLADLKDALKYIYRAARTSLEENGANNLYLVLGVLKWYETDRSQQPRYAPLLLLPIEMVRSSGTTGYVIRARDEDTVLNITLAQLLQQQYDINLSMLEELPKDEAGIDVKKVLAIVRDKIRSNKGWNVLDEAMIGIFSFNKFVMWHDIHINYDLLHDNEIISSLVDGRLNITNIDESIDAKMIDRKCRPVDFITPIDVDSSQLEAVIAAGEGQSFILHGPPGTGKSQTITNIIANALYQGKRVLFVAEKMAALSVVQSRLSKIGLGPFCLELHSNKVTKRHFLAQMEEALNITRHQSPSNFQQTAEEVYKLRTHLIDYIDMLHEKSDYDLSLYDCISRYIDTTGPELDIDIDSINDLGVRKIEALHDEISALDTVIRITGAPGDSDLFDLDIIDGSSEAERSLSSSLKRLEQEIDSWTDVLQDFQITFGIDIPDSAQGFDWAVRFLRQIQDLPLCNGALMRLCLDETMTLEIREAVVAGESVVDIHRRLSSEYIPAILKLDAHDLWARWQQACAKWWLPRFFNKRAILQMMGAYKTKFNEHDLHHVIDLLNEAEDCKAKYESQYKEISHLFGPLARPGKEQWSQMLQILDAMPQLQSLIKEWSLIKNCNIRDAILQIYSSYTDSHIAVQDWYPAITSGLRILAALNAIEKVAVLPNFDSGLSVGLKASLPRWLNAIHTFRDWFLWCKSARAIKQQQLGCVIQYMLESNHSGREAADACVKGIYSKLARRIIDSDEGLRHFNGLMMDDVVKRYRRLTAQLQMYSKQELYCRLAANIPSQVMEAHDNSELGLLKRNIKNGGRGTSIRRIIDEIPTLLPKLCPCMLMSPISVAQYISLNTEKFDIVIFDEASQMPTSEAVGAIARGKSLIVVGDPKQMPPTSFFATSAVGEDEAYIDDMESILDDCISLSIPSKYLTWHYRSKHESLISFSNSQYYDGRLFTFPSTDDQVSKVTIRHIDGTYDKGKSRSNISEAQAIVAEVIARLRDPLRKHQSIGIVSFSKVQQDKIEDILTDELAKHPDLESIAYDGKEPIFIKNLENVQGDERDVILFSVGYGPDANGKVSMNFGPLNNPGGERRLNVAVSRARYEMMIFSSLRSEQIDLRRSNALGVVGLKKFLEYAESGNNTIVASDAPESQHEIIAAQIADRLKDHGFDSKLSIGRSAFKIDIALIDPDNADRFILGILLDGPNYHAVKTMRDREIVQPSVLRGLDWEVMRVWTLDWYERPQEVIKNIVAKIDNIRKGIIDCDVDLKDSASLDRKAKLWEYSSQKSQKEPSKPYKFAEFKEPMTPYTIEQLESSPNMLIKAIQNVVKTEQPITNTLIAKRIVKMFGLQRLSQRVQSLVDNTLRNMNLFSQPHGESNLIYWSNEASVDRFNYFRTNSDREIADIPVSEILIALRYAIDQQVAIDIDGLKLLTARLLGFTRVGSNIDIHLASAIHQLEKESYLIVEDGKVRKNS